jgi:cell division protein FtsW
VKDVVKCDRALIWTTLLLVLIGLLTVYTASADIAARSFGGSQVFLRRMAWRAALGLVALAFAYFIDYRSYRKYAVKGIFVAIFLLVTLLVFGEKTRGVKLTFLMMQPAEIAKLALVVYLADVLTRRQEQLNDFRRGLLPRLVLVAVVVGLILAQPDFGSALAVVVLAFIMLYLSGVKITHVAGLGFAAVPVAWFAVNNVSHITERWDVWRSTYHLSLDGLDIHGAAYQIYQSLVALGSGGLFGRGIGASLQRAFIPDPYTDFAFSIWGEEAGFLGAVLLVALFVFLMIRGLRIARRAPDLYGTILAAGLTGMMTTYAIINIAVATATMPTTGLPLPFVSYGGTSLVVNMAAIGILLNMSKRTALGGAKTPAREYLQRRWPDRATTEETSGRTRSGTSGGRVVKARASAARGTTRSSTTRSGSNRRRTKS